MEIKRILIADEDEANHAALKKALIGLGILDENIFITVDREQGLKTLSEKHIQMLCIAWRIDSAMPGTVFIQRMKQRKAFKHIPCLIYSRKISDDDIYLIKELGLENMIRAPFNEEQLQTVLKDIIEREKNIDPLEVTLRKFEDALDADELAVAEKLISPKFNKEGPFFVLAQSLQAEYWLKLEDYNTAYEFADYALAQDESCVKSLRIKAAVKSKSGNHEEALEILRDMVELAPSNMMTLLALGSACVDADEMDEAKGALSEVMKMDKDNTKAQAELGKVAFKEGDLELAKSYISQSGMADDVASYLNSMAIGIVHKDNDYERALEIYNDALQILQGDTKRHLITYNLGLTYFKMENYPAALNAYCESYLFNPGYEKAYAAIAKTYSLIKIKKLKYDKQALKEVRKRRKEHKKTNNDSAA